MGKQLVELTIERGLSVPSLNALQPHENRPRPFYCGTQATDWKSSNCDRCTKGFDRSAEGRWPCDLERAIDEAAWEDGTVSPDVGHRMGYDGSPTAHVWQCGEVVWTEEWKAESRRRRTLRYRAAKRWWKLRRWAREATVGRWEAWRERWRFRTANRHADDSGTCWADWVTWAMDVSGDQEIPEAEGPSVQRCRAQGAEPGRSCYCGRFQTPRTEDAHV